MNAEYYLLYGGGVESQSEWYGLFSDDSIRTSLPCKCACLCYDVAQNT